MFKEKINKTDILGFHKDTVLKCRSGNNWPVTFLLSYLKLT